MRQYRSSGCGAQAGLIRSTMLPSLHAAVVFSKLRAMWTRLQRIMLAALLCTLPVQGFAAALASLTCKPIGDHATIDAQAHVHDATAASDAYESSAHDAGYEHSGDIGHTCCHHFSSAAAPSVEAVLAPRDFPSYSSTVPVLTPLYFPELPQRPPRA